MATFIYKRSHSFINLNLLGSKKASVSYKNYIHEWQPTAKAWTQRREQKIVANSSSTAHDSLQDQAYCEQGLEETVESQVEVQRG